MCTVKNATDSSNVDAVAYPGYEDGIPILVKNSTANCINLTAHISDCDVLKQQQFMENKGPTNF